jgi:hypothetical protein
MKKGLGGEVFSFNGGLAAIAGLLLLGILPQQNCGCCSVLTTPDRILYFTIFVGPKNDVRRRRLHQVVAARREPSHFFTFHLEQPAGVAAWSSTNRGAQKGGSFP